MPARPRRSISARAGLTQRTWSGRFFTVPGSESTFFILGRNGEVGLPHTLVGEHQSLFEIRRGPSGIAVDKVFEEAERGTASSVDACDIDGDGSVEIYINNNGGPQSTDILQVHIVSVGAGKIVERYAATFLGGMDRHGSYNDVRFADADGDGECDLLAAIEVEKADETSSANANDRIQSYVILNRIGGFDGVRLDLPNPYFGKNNAAFSIEAAAVNGERLVALDSSEFRGHTTGFRKFAFQLFAFATAPMSKSPRTWYPAGSTTTRRTRATYGSPTSTATAISTSTSPAIRQPFRSTSMTARNSCAARCRSSWRQGRSRSLSSAPRGEAASTWRWSMRMRVSTACSAR